MRGFGAVLTLLALTLPAVLAQEAESITHWKVSLLDEDGEQFTPFLLKVIRKEGKLNGTIVPLRQMPPTSVANLDIKAELFKFQLKIGPQSWDYEGKLPQAGAKKILGSFQVGGQMLQAWLESTNATDGFELDRELLLRSPNDPQVFHAVLRLVRQAPARKVPVKDVQEWVETVTRVADNYGPRWQMQTTMRLAETLLGQDNYAPLAIQALRRAEQNLDPKGPADNQVRLLSALVTALTKAGQKAQAKEVEQRLDRVETQAYLEYKQNPSFKVTPFAGRKVKSERTVLVELFTGAQCPPCVAADMAFDALDKAFPATDVILLQYHLHIPRPDPLTNPDAEDRQGYYGEEARGTPSLFVNGKATAPGGGGRDDAEDKFQEYRDVIRPLLEKPSIIKLKAQAQRKGNKITIQADASLLEKIEDNSKLRLRLALVEDWVRYRGSNGLAYHHRVVRALPGGAKGFALDGKQSATVDLEDLRGLQNKYLDDLVQKGATFVNPQRPMRYRDLRVVAFVQNDATREILQAVETTIKDE